MRKLFFLVVLLICSVSVLAGTEKLSVPNEKNIKFMINEGVGGCGNCGYAVREMMNDAAKLKELIGIFPKDATVVFYVREPNGAEIPKGVIAVVVGSCANDLSSKGDVYAPGCRRQIDSEAVFRAILAKRDAFASHADKSVPQKVVLSPSHPSPNPPSSTAGAGVKENARPAVNPVKAIEAPPAKARFGVWTWRKWLDVAILITAMSFWSFWTFKAKAKRWSVKFMALGILLYFGFYRGGCPCPLGTAGNILLSIKDGAPRFGALALIFFTAPLLFAVFVGKVFCSSACPIGAVQELVSWKNLKIPLRVERVLRLGKYFVLALIFYAALALGNGLFFCKLDPFVSIFSFSGSALAFSIAFGLVALSVFISRPFCRWFCPYAVLLGVTGFFSFRKRHIEKDKCVDCKLCEKICPTRCVKVPEIDTYNCVMCDKCRSVCPKDAVR